MSYQVDLIYDITYTRNNQIVFPTNLTGVKKVTINCEGKFFTYQRTIQAYLLEFAGVTSAKNIVGIRVVPTGDKEYYYFVTGFAFVAPGVVEFNIEPDYFHTYLNNSGIKIYLAKTNYAKALRLANFASASEPHTANPCRETRFTKLLTGKYYYPAVTLAVQDKGVITGLINHKGTLQPGADDDLILWSQENAPFITKLNESGTTTYNVKPLRLFIIPAELIPESVAKLPTATSTIESGEDQYPILRCDSEIKSFSYAYTTGVDDLASKFRIGTAYDNIDVAHNFTFNDETNPILFSVRTAFNVPSFILRIGDKEIDITRGFEVDITASEYAQYKSQQQVSDAIQKVGAVTGFISSIGTSVVAGAMGNYLQAGTGLANGITSFAGKLAADYERAGKVTANAGGNVGFDNLLSEWGGLAVAKDFCLDSENVLREIGIFGYSVNNFAYELKFNEITTTNTFFTGTKVEFLNMGIPAPAATELEQTFISGIFISPFITQ